MDDTTGAITSATTRGFTGHEMVDDVSLVNMNGRIYDPRIGRFLSADPYVADIFDTQSLNRYAYVYNNPLTLTDLTGYFSFKKFFHNIVKVLDPVFYFSTKLYGAIIKEVPMIGQINAIIAGIACTYFTGGNVAAGAGCYAAVTALNTGVTTGSVKSALVAGTIAFATGVANYVPIIGPALVGGAIEKIQGGSFGHGAWLGAATSAIGVVVGGATGGYSYNQPGYYVGLVASAAAGGAVAVLGGGKFANGALTAAFAYVATSVAEGIVSGGAAKGPKGAMALNKAGTGPYERPLAAGEIEVGRLALPGKWDPTKVRVAFRVLSAIDIAFTPDNTISFPMNLSGCADFSTCGGGQYVLWFVHELTHTYQYQTGLGPVLGRLLSKDIFRAGEYLSFQQYQTIKQPESIRSTEKQADWYMYNYACNYGGAKC